MIVLQLQSIILFLKIADLMVAMMDDDIRQLVADGDGD